MATEIFFIFNPILREMMEFDLLLCKIRLPLEKAGKNHPFLHPKKVLAQKFGMKDICAFNGVLRISNGKKTTSLNWKKISYA